MATFFGEIIEPSTRALCEDCSDEEPDETFALKIVWKAGFASRPPDFNKFMVVDEPLTLAFAEAYLLDPKQSKNPVVGEIEVVDETECSENLGNKTIASSPLILVGDFLLCLVHPTLPSKAAFDFAELVSSLVESAKEVTVLTSQPASNFKTSPGEIPPENAVYSLVTSSFKGYPVRPPLLEPNIIAGIPAAVVSWCEIYKVAASLYVCYSDSEVLDSITAQPLLGIFPQRQEAPDLKRRWLYGGAQRRINSLSTMYM